MAKDINISVRSVGQYGLITDKPPHELPANVWTASNNARFIYNHVERIGGHIAMMAGETVEPKGQAYFNRTWQWGSTNQLWEFQSGGTPTEHQSRFTTTDDLLDWDIWSFIEFSGILVATHTNTDPVFWNGVTASGTSYTELPDWGNDGGGAGNATWRTQKLRTYKNQLIALNTTEDGIETPQRVRWSDIALPGAPPAEWDATSTTNSAGFNDLTGATSEIIDGFALGDNFVIYTKNEVYLMSYVGGNAIFAFRQVFNDGGALQANCITAFNNLHLVVASDDVYVHDGSSKRSVISERIKQDFFNQVKSVEYDTASDYSPRINVLTNKPKNEVWIFYTTELQDGEDRSYFSKAVIWNYEENTWGYTDVPNMSDVRIGGIPIPAVERWDTMDAGTTWDNYGPGIWDAGGKDIEEKVIVGSGQAGFAALDQRLEISDELVPFYLERLKIDLDEEIPQYDVSIRKNLKAMFPQFSGKGRVNIRIGTSNTPQESPNWQAPQVYDLETDYKIDLRATGRYLSIRIDALDNNDWRFENYMWRLGGFIQRR